MSKEEKILRANLVNEISLVEAALSSSYNNLQAVNEEGLIDYYTYKIKADEAKHKYLIEKLRYIIKNIKERD
jgi:hypothetical protein